MGRRVICTSDFVLQQDGVLLTLLWRLPDLLGSAVDWSRKAVSICSFAKSACDRFYRLIFAKFTLSIQRISGNYDRLTYR
jgi:hypothetical protein